MYFCTFGPIWLLDPMSVAVHRWPLPPAGYSSLWITRVYTFAQLSSNMTVWPMIRPRAILINISGRNQRQKKSVFCSDPIALLYSRCATSRQNADACLWAMRQSVVSSSGKIERRKQTVCVSGRVCSTIHSIHLHVQYSQIITIGRTSPCRQKSVVWVPCQYPDGRYYDAR